MLHQLGLGAPAGIVLDAVVAAHECREASVEEVLRGAHEQLTRPCLHILFLEVLQEEEEGGTWDFDSQVAWHLQQGALGEPLTLLTQAGQPVCPGVCGLSLWGQGHPLSGKLGSECGPQHSPVTCWSHSMSKARPCPAGMWECVVGVAGMFLGCPPVRVAQHQPGLRGRHR